MSEEQLELETGEVWGIRRNQSPDAPWFDICLILGISEATGNCVALSITSGQYIPDFAHAGMPSAKSMNGWERIL